MLDALVYALDCPPLIRLSMYGASSAIITPMTPPRIMPIAYPWTVPLDEPGITWDPAYSAPPSIISIRPITNMAVLIVVKRLPREHIAAFAGALEEPPVLPPLLDGA